MPIDPDQISDSQGPQGSGTPDSGNSHVFRPNALSHRPHSAPPPDTSLLQPPQLQRHPHETLNTTSASDSLFAPLEGYALETGHTSPVQRFVLLPDPAAMSPVLLPAAVNDSRDAIYRIAIQGLAEDSEMGRPVRAFSLGPPASTHHRPCEIPLAQEDSAFALTAAPTPPAQDEPADIEQEIEVALAGSMPFGPYAHQ